MQSQRSAYTPVYATRVSGGNMFRCCLQTLSPVPMETILAPQNPAGGRASVLMLELLDMLDPALKG